MPRRLRDHGHASAIAATACQRSPHLAGADFDRYPPRFWAFDFFEGLPEVDGAPPSLHGRQKILPGSPALPEITPAVRELALI